jgi:hypothetical protein
MSSKIQERNVTHTHAKADGLVGEVCFLIEFFVSDDTFTAASRQKLHHSHSIERPAKLRTIVDAPQYRDAHAVFFEQAVVVGDVDMLRNNPCLI